MDGRGGEGKDGEGLGFGKGEEGWGGRVSVGM